MLIFGFASAVGFPGLRFLIASGAIFGTLFGAVLSWTGAMVGAAGGYWLARTVGHSFVARAVARSRHAELAVEQARTFKGMLRIRLLPVLPLGMINFAGGLARVPFPAYMLATGIGVSPTTVIYAYFADSLLHSTGGHRAGALWKVLIASALLLALSLIPRFFRSKSRRLGVKRV